MLPLNADFRANQDASFKTHQFVTGSPNHYRFGFEIRQNVGSHNCFSAKRSAVGLNVGCAFSSAAWHISYDYF